MDSSNLTKIWTEVEVIVLLECFHKRVPQHPRKVSFMNYTIIVKATIYQATY